MNKNKSSNAISTGQVEKSNSNIQYKYDQNLHSLLGYFTINIENFEMKVNRYAIFDIITKHE